MQEVHDSFGCCEDPNQHRSDHFSLCNSGDSWNTSSGVSLTDCTETNNPALNRRTLLKPERLDRRHEVSPQITGAAVVLSCVWNSCTKMFLLSSVENISSFFKQKWYVAGPYCTQFWGRQQIREQKRQHGAIKQTLHSRCDLSFLHHVMCSDWPKHCHFF